MNKSEHNQGFSLLEITIAVGLFSLLMVISVEIFQSVIKGQRGAVAAQNMQENIRYVFEMMDKEIRNAQLAYGDCDTTAQIVDSGFAAVKKIYNTNAGNDLLSLKNKDGVCTVYYLSGNTLRVRRSTVAESEAAVTPVDLKINSIKFLVDDNDISAANDRHAKVTIVMDAEISGNDSNKNKMSIQTTISSRNYE